MLKGIVRVEFGRRSELTRTLAVVALLPALCVADDTFVLYDPEITWSGDSSRVIAPAVKSKEGWDNITGGEIYAFPREGGGPVALTSWSDIKRWCAISPDGKHIAFVGYPWKGQTYHVAHLYVADADGSNQRNLTPDWDRDVAAPTWSQDSSTLYFLSEDDWRTPIAQSQEFYRALKVQGVDTVLIRVPGESHGIRQISESPCKHHWPYTRLVPKVFSN